MSAKAWDQLLAYEATLGAAFAGLPAAVESAPADWKVTSAAHPASLYSQHWQDIHDMYALM